MNPILVSARKAIANNAFPLTCKYSGMNFALRAIQQTRLLVLCYHGVISDGCSKDPIHYDYTASLFGI